MFTAKPVRVPESLLLNALLHDPKSSRISHCFFERPQTKINDVSTGTLLGVFGNVVSHEIRPHDIPIVGIAGRNKMHGFISLKNEAFPDRHWALVGDACVRSEAGSVFGR